MKKINWYRLISTSVVTATFFTGIFMLNPPAWDLRWALLLLPVSAYLGVQIALCLDMIWKKSDKKSGFTLIELLIVVAILGILAAVVIPNVASFLLVGKVNAANTEVANIQTAETAYVADHQSFPVNSNALAPYLNHNPTGVYIFDSNGAIVDASGWFPLTFDLVAGKWNK